MNRFMSTSSLSLPAKIRLSVLFFSWCAASAAPILLKTGDMSLTLEGPAEGEYGTFRDGIHWTTVDTRVLAADPPPGTFQGERVDGYSVNPNINDAHGFDSRYDMKQKYEPPPALPVNLEKTGDVFISVRSQREQTDNDGGHYVNAQAIVRLERAPPANAFAPPLVHWQGRTNWDPVVIDVGATLNRLPVFSAEGVDLPPARAFLERIDTLNLYMIGAGATRRYYGNFFPYRFGSSSSPAKGNYGVNLTRSIGSAFLALLTDAYSREDKEAILTRLLHMGVQWTEPLRHGGNPKANGGINQFQFLPVALHLYATHRLDELEGFLEVAPLNQRGHFFRWNKEKLAELEPHGDLKKQISSRLRPVLKVEGNQVTFETIRFGGQGSGDLGQMSFTGSLMTRVSDGAQATVTGMPSYMGKGTLPRTAKIDKQPEPPFRAGDRIYFAPQPGLEVAEGVAEYSLNVIDDPQGWQPTANAAYRPQIEMTADAVAHQVLGLEKYTSRLTPMRDYIKRVNNATEPLLPPVGGAFLDPETKQNHNLQNTFWEAHRAALSLGEAPAP